jgi:hypothetical protein
MNKQGLLKDISSIIVNHDTHSVHFQNQKELLDSFLSGKYDQMLGESSGQLLNLKAGLSHVMGRNTPELNQMLKSITDDLFQNQTFNQQMKPFAVQLAPLLLLEQKHLFRQVPGNSGIYEIFENFQQSLKLSLVVGKAKYIERNQDLFAAKDESGITFYKIGNGTFYKNLSPADETFKAKGMDKEAVRDFFLKNPTTIGQEDLDTAMKYQYKDDLARLMPRISENLKQSGPHHKNKI